MYTKYGIIILIGLICGLIEASLGISFMIVPLLLAFEVITEYKIALATTLCAFILPLSVGAVYIHYNQNNIEIKTAILLAITYFIGASLSPYIITGNVSNKTLVLLNSILLFIFGAYFLYKYCNDSE